jgi:hypothetical protein
MSYRTALAAKAHRIAETLIKPHAVEMAKCMLDMHVAEEQENIQLFTVALKTYHMILSIN